MSNVIELGGGYLLNGILLLLLAAIGFVNIGIGALLTIEKMLKSDCFATRAWFWLYIIIGTLSIIALKEVVVFASINDLELF